MYGLDDSNSDEGESSDDDKEEGDSEDALEEALLRGGRHAQRECAHLLVLRCGDAQRVCSSSSGLCL